MELAEHHMQVVLWGEAGMVLGRNWQCPHYAWEESVGASWVVGGDVNYSTL
jgi:hypothetical protein